MEKSTSIKSLAYQYGLILAVYSIFVLVVLYVMNVQEQNWMVGTLNVIVTIIIFVAALKTFKNNNGGYMSLSEALKLGLAVAAVGGLIVAIYSYFHYSFIHPEFVEMARENAMLEISSQGMGEAQMKQAKEMSEIFTSPIFFATISLILTLFSGFIISLIAGLIMKKDRP